MLNDHDILNLLSSSGFSVLDKVLFILIYLDDKAKTVSSIRNIGLTHGFQKIKKTNISQILQRSKGKAALTPDGWVITIEGKNYLFEKEIPQLKNLFIDTQIRELRKYFANIKDKNTLAFLNEAIICLEADLLRASVVFSWVGAISVLHEYIINDKLIEFNTEAKKRFSNWRTAKTKDDLTRMTESHFLDVLEAISVIGPDIKKELQNNGLRLRNSCGHPNTFVIGQAKVAAHIEVLILNIFSKF